AAAAAAETAAAYTKPLSVEFFRLSHSFRLPSGPSQLAVPGHPDFMSTLVDFLSTSDTILRPTCDNLFVEECVCVRVC
uniref:Uncharacterized protein n=1 Tax=Anopheles dirus TaxID=7168 RepID=A0A182NVX6_9DIPT